MSTAGKAPGLTEEHYNRVIQAFREDKPLYRPTIVARQVGIDYRTVRKMWTKGYPKLGWLPVELIFKQEQEKARALIQAEQAATRARLQKEREDGIAQAAQARAQEGQLVVMARGSALAAVGVGAQLVQAARQLVSLAKAKIEEEAKRPVTDPMQMTAGQCLNMLDKIANLERTILGFSHEAMQMERLHLGQPGAIIGVAEMRDMTIDEAAARIDSAQKALLVAREVGGLTVIDGGLSEPIIGQAVR